MPPLLFIIIWIFVFLVFIFYMILKRKERQINTLEDKIKNIFLERTWIVPALFEVSRSQLNQHETIFHEILQLRKLEFAQSEKDSIYKMLPTKKLIHYEINFIFQLCNKHPRLIRKAKFIYLRNVIIEKSALLWKNIIYYKKSVTLFNRLITVKNFTIIGFLLPIRKKIVI